MHFTSLTAAVLSLLAANAAAKTIQIKVGDSGKDFSPNSVTAEKGDVIEYSFMKNKHSVVAGDFTKGCNPLTPGGFFSGLVTAGSGTPTTFQVTVNNTDPIFFYCSYASHCQGGMVGVINPSSDQTLDKFTSSAKAATSNVAPEGPYGGMLMKGSDSSTATTGSGSGYGSTSTATSSSSSSSATQTKTGAAGHLGASLLTIAGAAAAAAAFLV